MKDLINNNKFKILKYLFIIVSIISVLYATFTMRGLYHDGTYYMINILNNMANNDYSIVADNSHPRQIMLLFMQIPVWIFNILHLNDKKLLIYVFTFTQMFLPLLVLYWNYKLSERTNRPDIFFWHLFLYMLILIPCSIFSVVELIIGAGLSFILWNYLANDIEYKLTDYFAVTFLLICMFGTYEYNLFLGIIFFIASLKFIAATSDAKIKKIKFYIGVVSLLAALYNLVYICSIKNNGYQILRFAVVEALDFIPRIFQLCSIISVFTIIYLFIFRKKEEILSAKTIGILSVSYIVLLITLLLSVQNSLIPLYETHFRTIVCWLLPLIFIVLTVCSNKKICTIMYTNFIIITLLCGISQTCWQIVNTYYWDKNITHVKQKLEKAKELLYIPEQHDILSWPIDERLYRYIWHGTYPALSILLSDSYEQKTLLLIYKKSVIPEIKIASDDLYKEGNKLSVPALKPRNFIDLKNRYWDLNKCADALDEYNKAKNQKLVK